MTGRAVRTLRGDSGRSGGAVGKHTRVRHSLKVLEEWPGRPGRNALGTTGEEILSRGMTPNGLVGAAGIEPATICSQSRYATAALRPVGAIIPPGAVEDGRSML